MRRSARLIGLRSMTSARRARHVGRRFGPLLVALSINVFLLCKVTSADSEAGADADAGGRGSGCGRDIVNLQSKCVLSPVVFEGSVLVTGHSVHDSWTTARLKVSLVHKGDVEENWVVNVGFHGEREEEETNGQCVFRRDIFQVSKKYLVFAAWDLVGTTGNASTATPDARDRLVVFSEPVLRSKNSSRIVRKTLCSGCIKEPSVSGLKSRTARPNSKVQLKCKAKGNPVPDITWFKDDHPVTRTENIIINQTKTISKLTIKKMSTSDVGTYECRATSAFGPPASSKASLRLGAGSKIRPTLKPSSTMGPDKSRPCGGYDEYCLNGGKCFFYETLGEYVCQCAEGYKGRRCESKGVYHHGSMDWTYHINILTVVVILAGFLFCLTIGGIVAYFIHRKKKQWETNEPESRRRSRKRISKISVGSVEVIEMKELSESFLQPASEDKIFNTSARCEVSAQFHGQAATAAPDRVKQLDSNENLMNSSGFHRNMPEQRTVPSRSASQNNQRPGRHSHTSLQETAHFPDIVASGNSLNKSRPAKP